MSRDLPHPFLKWAGGKYAMLKHVLPRLPKEIGVYGEFMVGAGAVFLELARLGRFREATISDSNAELMNVWSVLKEDVDGLVSELRRPSYRYDRGVYLSIRALDPSTLSPVEAAARFVYLNRTCFNGLYRVNSSGQFNVPFGRYSDPVICDEDNLRAVSAALAGVTVRTASVVHALDDFGSTPRSGPVNATYVDPPYIPLSRTSSFTGYTEDGFSMDDHVALAGAMSRLARSGFRVVTSNSSAPESLEVLKDFDVDFVTGRRSVAGGAGDRRSVQEIVAFAGPRS